MSDSTPDAGSPPPPESSSITELPGNLSESSPHEPVVIRENIENLSVSLSDRIEALAQELRGRWRAGRRVPIEELSPNYESIAADDEQLLDLIYHEVLIREEFGEQPSLAEYVERFPQHEGRLERLFAVHGAIEGDDDWGAELEAVMSESDAGNLNGGTPSPTQYDSDLVSSRALWPRRLRDQRPVEPPPGYELLEELGRGGMAVVFRARQQILNRIVALKMLLGGSVASAETLARLQQEARAVAQLQHPGIVQIYEVGEHKGLPYLSLEYVAGGTLHELLQGRPLSAHEAARIIEQLARTTAFAHERGIVHRDLKPANILLTKPLPEPQPSTTIVAGRRSSHGELSDSGMQMKISDFGLARMGDSVDGLTATGQVIGTPSYMAPEQAAGAGDAASPALDIYSLGAILYELLTGRPPFRGATLFETLDQVRSNDPVPPRQLQPKTPRDIETVCLKCLEKSPDRRYLTASDLAADLRAFLEGESIAARPAGPIERCGKRIRRYPAVTALIVLIVLLLIGGQAAILNEARRANLSEQSALADSRRADREADTANFERQKAQEAATAADDARFEAESERKRAVEAQAVAEVALERTLKALNSVGELGNTLKSKPGQEQVGKQLLDQTLSLYEELLSDETDNPAVRRRRVMALAGAGEIHRTLNNETRAEELLKEAAELIEPELDATPENFETYHRGTRIWWNLGVLYKDNQRWEESLTAFEKARSIHDAALEVRPDSYLHQVARTNVLINICVPLRVLGRREDAAATLELAIAAGRGLVEQFPNQSWAQSELALAIHDYSQLLRTLDRNEEADKSFDEALVIRQKVFDRFPNSADARVSMTRSWFDQASRDFDAGNLDSAIKLLRQGEQILKPLISQSPDVFDYQDRLLGILNLHLRATIRLNQKEDIEAVLTEVCDRLFDMRSRFPNDSYSQRQAVEWLQLQGNILLARGNEDEAAKHYRAANEAVEAVLATVPSSDNYETAWFSYLTGWRLGTCPIPSLRDSDRALKLVDKALEFDPNSSRYIHARGAVLMEAGRYEEAREWCDRSMELQEQLYRERHEARNRETGANDEFSMQELERHRYYHRMLQLLTLYHLGERDAAIDSYKLVKVDPFYYSAKHSDMHRFHAVVRRLLGVNDDILDHTQ